MLVSIGEDPGRHGLIDTPSRAAKAMMYFTKGYEDSTKQAVSEEPYDFSLISSLDFLCHVIR